MDHSKLEKLALNIRDRIDEAQSSRKARKESIDNLDAKIKSFLKHFGNRPRESDETLAALLVNRGIVSFDDAKNFFRPKLEHLHNPFLMMDMDIAVKRIDQAISNKENILIYGDYDVDGTTAVSLVFSYIKTHTQHRATYIPDRYE